MQRTPEDIQDELLVLRCQGGDADAFRLLVSRWQPRLRGMMARLTADGDAAIDLTQDVWMAVIRGLRRLEDPARFRVWVYRIAANKCADWVRRRAVRRDAAEELRRVAISKVDRHRPPATDEADEIVRMRAALQRLPEELHTALSLHYLDGLSLLEVATVFKVPVGTIKSRLHNARAHLRDVLLENHCEGTGRENC